jgi:hypothetical protein
VRGVTVKMHFEARARIGPVAGVKRRVERKVSQVKSSLLEDS